jgi:hypothetical protein
MQFEKILCAAQHVLLCRRNASWSSWPEIWYTTAAKYVHKNANLKIQYGGISANNIRILTNAMRRRLQDTACSQGPHIHRNKKTKHFNKFKLACMTFHFIIYYYKNIFFRLHFIARLPIA